MVSSQEAPKSWSLPPPVTDSPAQPSQSPDNVETSAISSLDGLLQSGGRILNTRLIPDLSAFYTLVIE